MNSLSKYCTISLTHGFEAFVDEEDYEYLSRFRWQARLGRYCWYASTRITISHKPQVRRSTSMHREIFLNRGIDISEKFIDHADRDGLNNRFSNLRIASCKENNWNTKIREDNSSGYKGVHYHVPPYGDPTWRARLQVDGKRLHLGLFPTAVEAAIAYNEAAIKYYGDFASLNIIDEVQSA
jgi:hypothetical protein